MADRRKSTALTMEFDFIYKMNRRRPQKGTKSADGREL